MGQIVDLYEHMEPTMEKALQMQIVFGDHKGSRLEDLDLNYLKWLEKNIAPKFSEYFQKALRLVIQHKTTPTH